ncbi:hypothetical protein SELMODRAFT_427421 [Selaginella moellendorffii]|uniref:Uncharacterized protein n=1 Tax=Selaginella moellendorffii TaxID=88036 RepID=D8SZJ2_SELML|nr:hypothetical protein SELMODRAFT_427421 [Selaginella moellendorffii]
MAALNNTTAKHRRAGLGSATVLVKGGIAAAKSKGDGAGKADAQWLRGIGGSTSTVCPHELGCDKGEEDPISGSGATAGPKRQKPPNSKESQKTKADKLLKSPRETRREAEEEDEVTLRSRGKGSSQEAGISRSMGQDLDTPGAGKDAQERLAQTLPAGHKGESPRATWRTSLEKMQGEKDMGASLSRRFAHRCLSDLTNREKGLRSGSPGNSAKLARRSCLQPLERGRTIHQGHPLQDCMPRRDREEKLNWDPQDFQEEIQRSSLTDLLLAQDILQAEWCHKKINPLGEAESLGPALRTAALMIEEAVRRWKAYASTPSREKGQQESRIGDPEEEDRIAQEEERTPEGG